MPELLGFFAYFFWVWLDFGGVWAHLKASLSFLKGWASFLTKCPVSFPQGLIFGISIPQAQCHSLDLRGSS